MKIEDKPGIEKLTWFVELVWVLRIKFFDGKSK